MIHFNFIVVFSVTLSAGTFLVAAQQSGERVTVSDACLGCISEALNGSETCWGGVCGIYNIMLAYCEDAGKPTLHPEDDADADDAYRNCVMDTDCGVNTVKKYMSEFAQDCNGDGKVDCIDFALIHFLGAYGCKKTLSNRYFDKFVNCHSKMTQDLTFT